MQPCEGEEVAALLSFGSTVPVGQPDTSRSPVGELDLASTVRPRSPPVPRAPAWDRVRIGIDRTGTGLLLLVVGSLLGWIPILAIVGAILSLAGVVFLMIGRKPFGSAHSAGVVVGALLLFLGLVGVLVLAVFVASESASVLTRTTDVESAESSFRTYFYWTAFLALVGGFSPFLLTWALQRPLGRMLVVSGYTISGFQVASLWMRVPEMSSNLADALSRSRVNLRELEAAVEPLNEYWYLSAVSSILLAVAFYLAWKRIERGDIPTGPTQEPRSDPVPPT